MATIFKNQELTVTLTAKDDTGAIISLAGDTVHFLTRDPEGVITIDETPTIGDPTNGQVEHIHAVDDLNKSGEWMDKLLIDTDEVPSTRYKFTVYERWER